jgi:hypothetical protein
MRRPSSLVLGTLSISVTLATTAAAVLEWLPKVVWIVTLILGVALGLLAVAMHVLGGSPPTKGDPVEELKAQLAEVGNLRTWLLLRDNPDAPLPFDEDRVFQWAKKSYKLIQKEFPVEADAFMGERDASLGSAHFATAYAFRRDLMGRSEYLESRADIVRRILRTH